MAVRDEDEYFADITDVNAHSQEFQGKIIDEERELLASEFAPLTLGRQGNLEYIILSDGTEFTFNDEAAYAVMDRRKNIYFVGDVQFPQSYHANDKTGLNVIGQVQRFSYRTDKEHIEDNRIISYYHDFGEVDGQLPSLAVDFEGMPLLIGGNYAVKREGVIN